MNTYKAFTHRTPDGWQVFIRLARDSHARPLNGKGAKPQIFTSELEAQRAVNHFLLDYLNGDYRWSGIGNNSEIRRRAEKLFGKKEQSHAVNEHSSTKCQNDKQ